jgi:hypothetical protein
MQLHYLARKKESTVPKPEVLEKIHTVSKEMTVFEKDYAAWVNDLYTKGIDVAEIKRQIKILAKFNRHYTDAGKQASRDGVCQPGKVVVSEEVESCKPKNAKYAWWSKDKRFTQLCALRASMRGRTHFSPNTESDTLSYHGLAGIDIQSQLEWIKEVAEEFTSKGGN